MPKAEITEALAFAKAAAPSMADAELLNHYAIWAVRTSGPDIDRDALPRFEVCCVYRAEILRRMRQ
jgi:hypothetical protein